MIISRIKFIFTLCKHIIVFAPRYLMFYANVETIWFHLMCMNKILTSLLCKCYKFSFVKCTSDGCMAGITLCGGVAATKTHATPHLVIFTHEPMRGVTLVRRNRRVPQHAAATQTRRRRSQRRINQIMERKHIECSARCHTGGPSHIRQQVRCRPIPIHSEHSRKARIEEKGE